MSFVSPLISITCGRCAESGVMASASPSPTGRRTPAEHGTDRAGNQKPSLTPRPSVFADVDAAFLAEHEILGRAPGAVDGLVRHGGLASVRGKGLLNGHCSKRGETTSFERGHSSFPTIILRPPRRRTSNGFSIHWNRPARPGPDSGRSRDLVSTAASPYRRLIDRSGVSSSWPAAHRKNRNSVH